MHRKMELLNFTEQRLGDNAVLIREAILGKLGIEKIEQLLPDNFNVSDLYGEKLEKGIQQAMKKIPEIAPGLNLSDWEKRRLASNLIKVWPFIKRGSGPEQRLAPEQLSEVQKVVGQSSSHTGIASP